MPEKERDRTGGSDPVVGLAEFRELTDRVEHHANEIESLTNRINTLVRLMDSLIKRVDRLEA